MFSNLQPFENAESNSLNTYKHFNILFLYFNPVFKQKLIIPFP